MNFILQAFLIPTVVAILAVMLLVVAYYLIQLAGTLRKDCQFHKSPASHSSTTPIHS